jgi:hypothetical protein
MQNAGRMFGIFVFWGQHLNMNWALLATLRSAAYLYWAR